jgi:hypothetical protein
MVHLVSLANGLAAMGGHQLGLVSSDVFAAVLQSLAIWGKPKTTASPSFDLGKGGVGRVHNTNGNYVYPFASR